MISRYEQNKQKYQEVVQHARNHPNIAEEIKEEILDVMEKYRFAISWMEKEEVKELIDKCVIESSSRILKTQLHRIGVGSNYSSEDSLYNNDKYSVYDIEDDCYNLD